MKQKPPGTAVLSAANFSRRDLLVTTAATAALGLPAWSLPASVVPPAEALLAVFRDRAAARRMGRAVITALPRFGEQPRVTAALLKDLAFAEGGGISPDAEDIRTRISRSVRTDFAAERTIMVDGWLLSVTEAQLYALAALAGI